MTTEPVSALGDIAHTIELAIAPVFLIAGIGALLNVLTSRLGRVVDRSRTLEAELDAGIGGEARDRALAELLAVDRRMKRINAALTLATLAALLICLVIMFLFTGELLAVNLARMIAALFIATMAAMIGALCFFLGEIGIATKTLRVRAGLLEKRGRELASRRSPGSGA
jgi:hypothetical protein